VKQTIKLKQIRIDGGTQARAKIDENCVADYSERIGAKDGFPPAVVFHDGTDYWLADGFHRWHALNRLERKSAEFDVRKGTNRDAVLFAAGANGHHGLRRTHADKRKAVSLLLADSEWASKSDAWIALACCVGSDLVADCRKGSDIFKDIRTTRDGKTISTANRGRPTTKGEKQADDLEGQVADFSTGENPPETGVLQMEPAGPFAEVFSAKAEFAAIVQQLGKTLSAVDALRKTEAGTFLSEAWQRIEAAVKNAQQEVKFSAPDRVCPYCQGEKCKPKGGLKSPCRQTGWVSKGVKGPGK